MQIIWNIFFPWRCDPTWVMASSFTRFLDYTQQRTILGRTPLDEWSACRRDLYLTTHNTHSRQIAMPPVGFEPTISAGKRPQTTAWLTLMYLTFNVHGSVNRKNILIYIQQDATLHSLFYLETALHISGGTNTHHQERKQLYLQRLVFVTPLLLSAAIAAGSSNSVTNNRRCRYSCLRFWWVEVPPETCRAVFR
jgi:hypothetical protein